MLQQIHERLTIKEPFFGKLFNGIEKIENQEIGFPVCLVQLQEEYYLIINPAILKNYSVRDQCTLIIHELLHYTNQHHNRRYGRDVVLWNIACDCAVNSLLEEKLTNKLRKILILPEIWKLPINKSAEWYYDKLKELGVNCNLPRDSGWNQK